MHIQLKQEELELAVKEYIVRMGVTRPVGDIEFTITRNPQRVGVEVQMHDLNTPATEGTTIKPAVPAWNDQEVAAEPDAAIPTPEPEEDLEQSETDDEEDGGKSLFG